MIVTLVTFLFLLLLRLLLRTGLLVQCIQVYLAQHIDVGLELRLAVVEHLVFLGSCGLRFWSLNCRLSFCRRLLFQPLGLIADGRIFGAIFSQARSGSLFRLLCRVGCCLFSLCWRFSASHLSCPAPSVGHLVLWHFRFISFFSPYPSIETLTCLLFHDAAVNSCQKPVSAPWSGRNSLLSKSSSSSVIL